MDIALVHGSYHGAWCWELPRPELERLGHRVITVDLAISDPSARGSRLREDRFRRARSAHETAPGRSLDGGSRHPPRRRSPTGRRLVFLASFLPSPGMSANDQRKAEPIDGRVRPVFEEWTDLGDDVWMIGPNTATKLFYHDTPAAVARWATKRLRPQSYRVLQEVSPLTAWPDVERSSIVCREDRAINPEWVRTAARERLGVDAIELAGGHSPFLSRPSELARVIDALG